MFDHIGDIGPARGDAGDRRDVVDLEGMLHTQQKSESRNSKHAGPPCLAAHSIAHFTRARDRMRRKDAKIPAAAICAGAAITAI